MDMTTTDMMTRLKMKHYFFTVLINKLDQSALEKLPLGILMLDIDHFKRFNDTYGHACGDLVLKEVAAIIKNSVRSEDLAARYGGEEFVVMLYDTNEKTAVQVAERIRKNIETLVIEYEGNRMNVTISIGIALCLPDETIQAKPLVECADTALYESKHNGRNRSTVYLPSMKIQ